jgi:hypothetical protein
MAQIPILIYVRSDDFYKKVQEELEKLNGS